MKKYNKYKDSGIEWIGEIPEHWALKKIKHTTYVKGRIGWKGLRSDEFLELSDSYVVTGTDFENGKIKWKTCYQVPIERYEDDPFIKLKNDDLLITKDGTIGKIAVVKDMPKIATLNSGVFLTRPYKAEYSQEFMYWILFSEVFKTFYDYNKSGSTIQHLYQNVFNEFEYVLPPISEQTTIANYLDHKTTQIDTLITKKEQFITLLQEERTALINQAVTKGLDPKVKMKDSGIEWLGEIPEHWEVKKLKYFANVVLGKMLTTEDKGDCHLKPYLRAKNIEWNKPNIDDVKEMWFSNNEIINFRIKKNDLLVSEGGEVGRTCIWNNELDECYIQNSVHKVTILANGDSNYFLNQFVLFGKMGHFDAIVNRISIAHLTKEKLKDVSFFYPPKNEQSEISNYIQVKSAEIDTLISKAEQEIELLKEYKTALISEVVTGKVDVRDAVLN